MKSMAVMLAMMGVLLVGQARGETPLLLERKIPLGEVRGRIDHLAVDLQRNRLFVAELESDAVAVVDLDANRLLQVIPDLRKPQGLGYDRATDTLYVANGGDGTVAVFRGNDFSAVARIAVGEDAEQRARGCACDASVCRLSRGIGGDRPSQPEQTRLYRPKNPS